MKRIVVGITGATGSILGIRLLEKLRDIEEVETHLIISKWAAKTMELETEYRAEDIIPLADVYYDFNNVGASVASGSFRHDGMVIMPCSMKTVAAVSCGYTAELISRAADVTLKEKRPLVLAVREMPLNQIHLENMLKLARTGALIFPFLPSFYNCPNGIAEMIDNYLGKVMSHLSLETNYYRWQNNDKGNTFSDC